MPRSLPPLTARLLLACCTLCAAIALAGCGDKQDVIGAPRAESIDLVLDFFPNADHAGIYAAISRGEFRRAGLRVRPRAPSDPAAPLKLLAAGRADLAISYEPELLLARDRGLKLVSVGALVQKPLTSIISLGSAGIDRPADLAGKRVATAGIPYQSAYLKAILERADVDPESVREVNVGFNLVPALLSRRADAALGAFWNYEGVQLAQRRRRPSIIRIERAGVPTYAELVIVARERDVRERGSRVRRFMRALARGHEAVRDDPARAVRALLRANPDLDRRHQLASLRATIPVFFPADEKKPFGYQDRSEWAAYGSWMLARGLVKRPPAAQRALTNEFLPGEGL